MTFDPAVGAKVAGLLDRFLLGAGRLLQVKGRHTPTNPRMPRELRNFSRPKL